MHGSAVLMRGTAGAGRHAVFGDGELLGIGVLHEGMLAAADGDRTVGCRVSAEPRALGLADLPEVGRAVVTLGVFDGVHLGHQALLEATRQAAAAGGMSSIALVFDPPPEEVLRPGTRVARLAPLAVNLARIETLVDRAIPIHFDEGVRELERRGLPRRAGAGTVGGRPDHVAAQRLRTRSGRDGSPHAAARRRTRL